MTYKIAVLPGDGVGPEVVAQAVKVLRWAEKATGHRIILTEYDAGGAAIDRSGTYLPEKTLDGCIESDCVLFGSVGGPKWDMLPGGQRPEQAVLKLRKELKLYANLRPARLYPEMADSSPLRQEIVENGFDLLIVRELTGGIYFGEKGSEQTAEGVRAYDVEQYSEAEIRRIARVAFEAAVGRRGTLTSVDKANVLETSRLFRRIVDCVAEEYPQIAVKHMYVDNAAMQLVRNPGQFDVILTSNLFGDILSDEASVLTGSIGMLPSASMGGSAFGLYEPIHGSAPDIAGQDAANPLGSILSAAMLLRFSLSMDEAAEAVEEAVRQVLALGWRTADMMQPGADRIGTQEMGEQVIRALNKMIRRTVSRP